MVHDVFLVKKEINKHADQKKLADKNMGIVVALLCL